MRSIPRLTLRPTSLLFASLLFFAASAQSGCAARTVRTQVVHRWGVEADLMREVKGFTTEERGFEHPTIISVSRLTHILNAIEIETPRKTGGSIRQPAFHPDIVEETAAALAEGLAEADPNQEVGVRVIRKAMHAGILHKKYITSLIAHVKDELLYVTIKRVDWFVPKGFSDNRMPKPRRSYTPMTFRVVTGKPLYYAGPQTLEIAWRDPVFTAPFHLVGSTKGKTRNREILLESPIPKEELESENAANDLIGIGELSPEQLRALADLEEDRRQGLLTEAAYQRAKRELLRRR